MLKLNSISIGNYLSIKEFKINEYVSKSKFIIRVRDIEQDFLNLRLYTINGYPLTLVYPIYITEEWLKELSFTFDENYNEWFQYPDKSGLSIERDDYDPMVWRVSSNIKIEYIHQLQNIINMI